MPYENSTFFIFIKTFLSIFIKVLVNKLGFLFLIIYLIETKDILTDILGGNLL